MKKLIAVVALVTVAACSQSETAQEPAATEDAAAAEVMAADGQSPVGQYKVTLSDGRVLVEDLKADGTYTSTDEDGNVTTGTWEQKSPDVYCYKDDVEGAEQTCNTEQVGEDGVWTSTNPDGQTAIVERVTA